MWGLYSRFDVARAGWDFPEGTCAGYQEYPSDPVSKGLEYKTGLAGINVLDKTQDLAVKISFSVAGLGGIRSNWNAVLWQERLYISITGNQLSGGSKHAFISLLEYAEEELGVTHVVACLDKLQHDNRNVIRNFLFFGFKSLAPGHEFQPSNPDVICFLYTI